MKNPIVCDVSKRSRYKSKKHPYVSMEDDPLGAFSQVSKTVLHVEDISLYIHCMFGSIGDNDIHKDLDLVCNGNLSLKQGFAHLKDLNIVKYIFHTEFDMNGA